MQVLAVIEHFHFLFSWLVLFVFTSGNDFTVTTHRSAEKRKEKAAEGLELYVREGRVVM